MSEFDLAHGDDYSDDYDDPDDWYPKTAVYSGTESFAGNHELTEVTFAQGVTSIGHETFYECSSLTAITIPDGVTTIGVRAFYGCSSLTAITIPDGVTTIGGGAFWRCSSLTAISIPDGVTSIGHATFWDCSALTKLILSPAVSIGGNCFEDCTALIAAAADKNMPTVSDLLHYRWHRNIAVIERVNALLCLKGTWDHAENQPSGPDSLKRKRTEVEAPLKATETRDKIPKVLWRVILEFL
ncbi:hypothetical protein TrCOL_g4751 [Triparma columacea]|uniref:Uncharacterized protein n=1 Tax=Triparma columacea TaxID=722753 RepID=A0A9W7FV05_9STRA|nr:hypothetical protein TrCOL_g4751 [Triparma columacea]